MIKKIQGKPAAGKKETHAKESFKKPSIAVDAIIIFGKKIVLIKRGRAPFIGMSALPGGFIEYGESAEKAAIREVLEETGLVTRIERLVGVYSDPERDPRGHTISVVFLHRIVGGRIRAGDDAASVMLVPLDDLKKERFAFDHRIILKNAGLL